jgi:hypothetical protein
MIKTTLKEIFEMELEAMKRQDSCTSPAAAWNVNFGLFHPLTTGSWNDQNYIVSRGSKLHSKRLSDSCFMVLPFCLYILIFIF